MKIKAIVLLAGLFAIVSCQKEDLTESKPLAEPEMSNGNNQVLPLQGNMNSQGVLNFRAHLTGAQEVPPVITSARGQTVFQLNRERTQLRFRLIVANLNDVTMAHIHLAPAGANGPVVVWLYPSAPPPQHIPGTTNGVLATGVITSADLVGPLAGMDLLDLVEYLQTGGAYVNVHTTLFPAGEIRGQIF